MNFFVWINKIESFWIKKALLWSQNMLSGSGASGKIFLEPEMPNIKYVHCTVPVLN